MCLGAAEDNRLVERERSIDSGRLREFVMLPLSRNGGGGGRLSPASLDVDTCGCPSRFNDPFCDTKTKWTLDKTTEHDLLVDPMGEAFLFDVEIVEGLTQTLLRGTGLLVITSSGEVPVFMSSVALLLEQVYAGQGQNPNPAPGPSGNNITGLGLEGPGDGVVPSDDDLRLDLIATFYAGGQRGGICSVDADCSGMIDEGEQYVRSIQQRLRFDPQECNDRCQEVTLVDNGTTAAADSCVDVASSMLDQTFAPTGIQGTTIQFPVSGDLSCAGGECATTITNSATLSGNDCRGLIKGSPATPMVPISIRCTRFDWRHHSR